MNQDQQLREPQAQAGHLHLKPPFEDENGNDISGEYITLQSHREAMAEKDAALKECVTQMECWRLAIAHESATQQGYDDFDAAIAKAWEALQGAKYAIKGREHTGFIDDAITKAQGAMK